MTTLIIAYLLTTPTNAPALEIEPPAWAFVMPAPNREPSPPVDEFLARLESAPLERAIERDLAAQPFELVEDPFDGRGTPMARAAVEEMIREGELLAGADGTTEILP
jgi:hypothetical protein